MSTLNGGSGARHVTELELQSYADGELPAARAREIETHANECPKCARFLEGERALAARVGSLPRGIAPNPELWRAIEGRIGKAPSDSARVHLLPLPAQAKRGRAWWKLGAGGVALAAAAALAFLASRPKMEVPANAVVASVTAPPPVAPPTPEAKTLAEEEPFLTALAALEADFESRKGSLPPEAAHDVDANLRILDAAIDSTRGAIETNPDNLDLKSQLADIYQQKIHVESDVIDLTARI